MTLQQTFSTALLDLQQPCPTGVFSPNGGDLASRFAVYRNNLQSGLINALASSYPVVAQLVGRAFFQAMAQAFIQRTLPTSPIMSDYGSDFADFIQGFEPAASVPYLADMARLERLCVEAYHAADAPPLDRQILIDALSDPASLAQLRLALHPGLATLTSPYAVATLWIAHQRLPVSLSPDLDPCQPQNLLVLRNALSIEVFAVGFGCVTFIRWLKKSCPLAQAADSALQADPDFDLSQALALLIAHGAITALLPHPEVLP